MFIVGNLYSRKDVYKLLGVPTPHNGKYQGVWATGYVGYNNQYLVFANVGVAGRTGDDYDNHWDGDDFHWVGKRTSHINQPTIQKMISGNYAVHIFTRTDNKNINFKYNGVAIIKKIKDTIPVQIIWSFEK